MREPRFEEAVETGKARKGGKRGASRGRTAKGRASKAGAAAKDKAPQEKLCLARPRIVGGKVVARTLYFIQQREVAEEQDTRKALGKAPTRALIVARPGDERRGRATTKGAKGRAAKGRASKGRMASSSPSLFEAFVHKQHLAAKTAAATPTQQSWRPMGPYSVPHGQTYGSGPGSRPSISGRVSSIAVDPSNASHILIGAGGGGVWESKDTGKTWDARTDDQPSLAIGAVAFNPRDTSIVYAGTGEGDSTFVDSPNLLGAGLLRSTDGGTSWTVHARAPFERQGFYDLVVDPLNGSHLLAATTEGLFESTNGGTSWTLRRNRRTWSLSMRRAVSGDPNSTKEVFAACLDGVFRSTNGGTSWSTVSLPGAPTSFERIEVCHAPSDGNVVYVVAAGPPDAPVAGGGSQPTAYIWRRGLFGGAFTRVNAPPDLETGQAWYDWFAGVAPNNPDVLYVGGINTHKGIRTAAGSFNWTIISAKQSGDSIHPDEHAIAFSPTDPNVVYVGCDGGIFRSPDGGNRWQSLNKGLCITEIEFLAQHPIFEAWVLAGTQDNGTMRYQGGEVWYHVADGDGGDCGINTSTPSTCYHTFYGMGVARSTRGGGWDTWPRNFQGQDLIVGPPASDADNYPDGALFYPPLEVNGRVVAQAGRTVFISSDGGTNWQSVALPSGARMASALAIPTTSRIFVGTINGRVLRIDLVDGIWRAPVPLAQPASGFISDIMVDPTNANRIYVAYQSSSTGARVFRSDNGGSSWVNISTGLPNIAINAIEIDPQNPTTIFAAADVGVYRSLDAGNSWTSFNRGLPNALVKDLLFHQPSRLLRAGTQARGVWEIAVDAATIPSVEIYLRDSTVDTGRLTPSPSGVNDPFNFGSQTFWFQCTDIKVDAPTFQTTSLSDVDFELFADDQSMLDRGLQFARGLKHENPQRNQTVRVYVQVHNRGVNAATNVAVKLFFAATPSLTFPNLPTNFWTGFPNNTVPASSAWQPIASHKIIESVEAGKSQIVGFEWPVPASLANSAALLAIITADNDSISTTQLNVASLVRENKKCGLKNLTFVNPSPMTAPPVVALPLSVARSGESKRFSLEADRAGASLMRGVVLSKSLSKLARKRGLKESKLTEEDRIEVERIIASAPELKNRLDLTTLFTPVEGAWLESFELKGKTPEALVVLINQEFDNSTYGSIIQKADDGTVVGGITLRAERRDQ
ncbi:MAG TPA: hypothetical protein VGB17_07760 [Pyrinomonadaceae bacterium]|jgi:photosystem II stability/assembly factor-like uncharacterized protein